MNGIIYYYKTKIDNKKNCFSYLIPNVTLTQTRSTSFNYYQRLQPNKLFQRINAIKQSGSYFDCNSKGGWMIQVKEQGFSD